MRHLLGIALLLIPYSAIADCGAERTSYMVKHDLTSANSLIVCLEHELLGQKSMIAHGIAPDPNTECPTFPITPIKPPTPGNPSGAELLLAQLQYYFKISGLSPTEWVHGAALAAQNSSELPLTLGNDPKQLYKYNVPMEQFDCKSREFMSPGNRMNIQIRPNFQHGGN